MEWTRGNCRISLRIFTNLLVILFMMKNMLTFFGPVQGEDVNLVGDFTGNWKEPVKASHKGGPRYEAEMKLPQGK